MKQVVGPTLTAEPRRATARAVACPLAHDLELYSRHSPQYGGRNGSSRRRLTNALLGRLGLVAPETKRLPRTPGHSRFVGKPRAPRNAGLSIWCRALSLA